MVVSDFPPGERKQFEQGDQNCDNCGTLLQFHLRVRLLQVSQRKIPFGLLHVHALVLAQVRILDGRDRLVPASGAEAPLYVEVRGDKGTLLGDMLQLTHHENVTNTVLSTRILLSKLKL